MKEKLKVKKTVTFPAYVTPEKYTIASVSVATSNLGQKVFHLAQPMTVKVGDTIGVTLDGHVTVTRGKA